MGTFPHSALIFDQDFGLQRCFESKSTIQVSVLSIQATDVVDWQLTSDLVRQSYILNDREDRRKPLYIKKSGASSTSSFIVIQHCIILKSHCSQIPSATKTKFSTPNPRPSNDPIPYPRRHAWSKIPIQFPRSHFLLSLRYTNDARSSRCIKTMHL
jgi:hypothetical protein